MPTAIVPLPDQSAMPGQQRFRCDNAGQSMEQSPAESFRFASEAAALTVSEADAANPDVLTQDAIFFHEVFDRMQFVLIHPAGGCKQQEPKRSKPDRIPAA